MNAVVFQKSFFDALRTMPPDSVKAAIIAVADYAFDGIAPEQENDPLVALFFKMAQPIIDAAARRYEQCRENGKKGAEHGKKGAEHGKKGGRPKAQTITPQITPQITPLNKDKEKDKEKEITEKRKRLEKENLPYTRRYPADDITTIKFSNGDIVTIGHGEYFKHSEKHGGVIRTYGQGQCAVPFSAPPRPSESVFWRRETNEWK